MNNNVFVDERVSIAALNKFYSNNAAKKRDIHTLQIYKDGERLVRIASEPYECTDKRQVYSLSKSFCSTAVGLAIEEGLFGLDDRIVDLFPESAPAEISENLSKMKVRHALSMNTGFDAGTFKPSIRKDEVIDAFMTTIPPYSPGTHFSYSGQSTFLLSTLVQKYTGMTILDYLDAKIFRYLDITGVKWCSSLGGVNEGATGFHISSDDIAKLGLLYLNRGVYNGKRLLPEEWVDIVHQPHSDNSSNGRPDWTSGYGFQFWVNRREGYRGDGSHGQICFILPERNMVIAVQAETRDMQGEVDTVYDLAAELLDKSADGDAVLEIQKYTPYSSDERAVRRENDGVRYRADANPMNITQFYVKSESDDTVRLVLSNGTDQAVIRAGIGHWISENRFFGKAMMPKLRPAAYMDLTEQLIGAASCRIEDGCPQICFRLKNSPHTLYYSISFEGERAKIDIGVSTTPGLEPECKIITGVEMK